VCSSYHLVPLVCCYCSVGYLSNLVDYSTSSLLKCFANVGVFSSILSTVEEAFGFTHGCGVQV
jgi:hypothetical protein